MRAAVTERVGSMSLHERPEPGAPGPGQVIVHPEAVGLCGSDYHFFTGEMSAAAGGSLFPRVLGHEVGATISAVGPACRADLTTGQRVAMLPISACGRCYPCSVGRPNACDDFRLVGIHTDGGLQELLTLPQEQVFPIQTGDGAIAAMAEPVSVAVHAVRRARIGPGERVMVLGAGPIGQCVAMVAIELGAEVLLIDLQESRLELGRCIGAETLVWTDAADTDALRANLAALPGFGEMKIKSLGAVLAKHFGVAAAAGLVPWHPTLGDVDSPQALLDYQASKKVHKLSWSASAAL